MWKTERKVQELRDIFRYAYMGGSALYFFNNII